MNDYTPFPLSAFPESVGRFVRETAEAMGCDAAFIGLPVLSTMAACIGTTREVELKRGWTEPPIIWACIIARSGTLKSPAMDAAVKPLADREHEAQLLNQVARAEHEKQMLEYEKALAQWKRKGNGVPPEKPEAPARLRYIVSDATLEAIAPLLNENPRGLLLARDELSGWIRGFNQYKAGKGGDAAGWLELHRAGRLTVDRKTDRSTIYVPRAAVSLCGTIQPAIFSDVMRGEHLESGLVARLLVAQPPTRQKRFSDRSASSAAVNGYAGVIGGLLGLVHEETEYGPRPFRLRLSDEAREDWRAWYDVHAKRQHEAGDDDEAAALAKIEGYAARFALIFTLVGDPLAVEVNADAVLRGCALANWLSNEAERVYGRLAEDEETRELRQLVEWINHRGGSVTARELSRGPRAYRGDVAGAERALTELVQAGMGEWRDPAPGSAGGRPSRLFVLQAGDSGDSAKTPAGELQTDVSSPSPVSPEVDGASIEADGDTLPPPSEEDAESALVASDDQDWGSV